MDSATFVSDKSHKVVLYYNEKGKSTHLDLYEYDLIKSLPFAQIGQNNELVFQNSELKVVLVSNTSYSVYDADETSKSWNLMHTYDVKQADFCAAKKTVDANSFAGNNSLCPDSYEHLSMPRLSIKDIISTSITENPIAVSMVLLFGGYLALKWIDRN